ncbi:hypothetical protein RN001_010724 [Aquatica leii]|uniref:DUF4806 domain-containing protein n=1 Tax=Aquatica leii TaxID=1421715 RepID=A0AAN7SNE8_9COLE|nr:hypothetical protein RN001_010724 [Aquatica leii]
MHHFILNCECVTNKFLYCVATLIRLKIALPGFTFAATILHKMSQTWDIVFWHEESSCDFVPSIWAVDEKKTIYLFPTNVPRSMLLNLIKRCEDPSVSKCRFKEHPATYKKTVNTLQEAEKLIEKAMDTDNFDNNDSEADTDTRSGSSILSEVQSNTRNESSASIPISADSVLEKESIILKELKSVKYEMRAIKQLMSALETKIDLITKKDVNSNVLTSNNFMLPIGDEDGLFRLEQMIRSEDNKKDLIRVLSLVGGESVRQNINNIIKKVLTKDIALKYSLRGKQKKKSFTDLVVYQAILDAVRVSFPNVTDVDINKFIGFALASAGDRSGGRKEREIKS